MTTNINIETSQDITTVCQALAEGEHDMGSDATYAGYMLAFAWAGADCPWFVPHPEYCGALGVADFDGFDLEPSF